MAFAGASVLTRHLLGGCGSLGGARRKPELGCGDPGGHQTLGLGELVEGAGLSGQPYVRLPKQPFFEKLQKKKKKKEPGTSACLQLAALSSPVRTARVGRVGALMSVLMLSNERLACLSAAAA